MKIAIACDHAGFDTKLVVKKFLSDKGHEVQDFGTNSADPVDYPDFIYPAALALSEGRVDRAILTDGAGYPSAAIAAVLPGVTPAVCFDTVCASLARQHSNTNALCLGGKLIGPLLATEIVRVWLETDFLGGRYAARFEKVQKIKERHLRPPSLLPRQVVTVQDVKDAFENREPLVLNENTIITPSVLDAIRNLR
jgi:ribose 5-phosphate isomerase B